MATGFHQSDTNRDGVITPEEKAAWIAANPGAPWSSGWTGEGGGGGIKTPWGTVSDPTKESAQEKAKREALQQQGAASAQFAGLGEQGYGAMTAEAQAAREAMRRRAMGQDSLSAEQLRQGLGQQLAMQRSMAASASPQNAPMAARTAAMQMGRASQGMAGNAAMAGIAERQAAEQALAKMIMEQRQQDIQVGLGGRQTAISGYGGATPDGSWLDRWGGAAGGAAGYISKSDRRAKTDIEDGDTKAALVLKGLKSYRYKYKDERDGMGEQYGIMADELEKSGLGHAVLNTPKGKYVDGAKAATASLGLVAALGRRVDQLEKKGRK